MIEFMILSNVQTTRRFHLHMTLFTCRPSWRRHALCDCPPDKRCDFHRDNIQMTMYEYLYKPTETTTANSTSAV
ncbi:UNVERIFIED_CONTAM: hypothetical protein NCL1_46465 [Trichonephila clavipes]